MDFAIMWVLTNCGFQFWVTLLVGKVVVIFELHCNLTVYQGYKCPRGILKQPEVTSQMTAWWYGTKPYLAGLGCQSHNRNDICLGGLPQTLGNIFLLGSILNGLLLTGHCINWCGPLKFVSLTPSLLLVLTPCNGPSTMSNETKRCNRGFLPHPFIKLVMKAVERKPSTHIRES